MERSLEHVRLLRFAALGRATIGAVAVATAFLGDAQGWSPGAFIVSPLHLLWLWPALLFAAAGKAGKAPEAMGQALKVWGIVTIAAIIYFYGTKGTALAPGASSDTALPQLVAALVLPLVLAAPVLGCVTLLVGRNIRLAAKQARWRALGSG